MIPISMGLSVVNGVTRAIAAAGGQPASARPAEFSTLLADVARSAPRAIADAESVASSAMQGRASSREVVERLMYAEQNLQIALAVRDKAVAALQEISRMAI